ncbi:MAG: WbuC family cupin fold metalloprotein [Chlorobi bacterium]|nr:WbuC family cupin fold metalloprotein [Chlorobiota bacterium]
MKIISQELLDNVTEQAKASSRRRMNYNFHENESDPLNRFLNALEPDTYIVPHRHKNPDKEEIILVLRGSLAVFIFDDDGNITNSVVVSPETGIYGIDINSDEWHSFVILEENTVIYEVKLGPYTPFKPEDFAKWAPAPDAGENEVKNFKEKLLKQLK